MFQFNFVCGDREAGQTSIDDEPSNPGDNTAIELALPGCVDVTGTDQILEANNRDVITISDSLRLFKGKIHTLQAAAALGEASLLESDLIPGKYEGGFKLWEGGVDLARFVATEVFTDEWQETNTAGSSNPKVLELGCGHALPGIVALLRGCDVSFHDYNKEVIEKLTIPNVQTNLTNGKSKAGPHAEYYYGDWMLLPEFWHQKHGKEVFFDVILTAETIYTLESTKRLYECIIRSLKPKTGVCYVAAKQFYFGVEHAGGVFSFLQMVNDSKEMVADVVAEINDGTSNKRAILKMAWINP